MKKFWNGKEISERNLMDLITECSKNSWKNSDLFRETEIVCEIIAYEDYEGKEEDIECIIEKLKGDGATLFDLENAIANGEWYFMETETWKKNIRKGECEMKNIKFELTENSMKWKGTTLYQIKALQAFMTKSGVRVSESELGGWVEKEENLSQDGRAWIWDNTKVCGTAKVYGDAEIWSNATICGNAKVYGNAKIYGDTITGGNAKVFGNAEICGDNLFFICGDSLKYGEEVTEQLTVIGDNDVESVNLDTTNARPILDVEFDSSTDHYEIKHIETMRTIKVNYNFVAGDKLRIDATRRRIYINGEIKMPTLTMSSAWFDLQSGDNHFEVSPVGETDTTIRYTPRYL